MPDIAEIWGQSATGKSTIIDGLCLGLLGVDSNGRPWASERKRTDDRSWMHYDMGGVLRFTRQMGSRPGPMTLDGVGKLTSQSAIDTHFGLTTKARKNLATAILAPGYWQRLLDSSGARDFRDMLVAALPPVSLRDIVAEMMSEAGGLREDDTMHLGRSSSTPDSALAMQKEANSAKDRAIGRLDAAHAALTAHEQAVPLQVSEPDRAEAQRIIAAHEKFAMWDLYRAALRANDELQRGHRLAVEAWETRRGAFEAQEAATVQLWDGRRAALGDRPEAPEYEPPPIVEHDERVAAAREKAEALQDDIATTQDLVSANDAMLTGAASAERLRVEAAERALEQLKASGECPTCGRKATVKQVKAAEEELQAAIDARTTVYAKARDDHDAKAAELERMLSKLGSELHTAKAMLANAEERHATASAAGERHRQAVEAVASWDRSMQALGERPVPRPFAEPVPAEPKWFATDRPDGEEVEAGPSEEELRWASETKTAAAMHAGRLADHEQRTRALQATVEQRNEEVRAASAEADRVAALVRSLRMAPTVAIARQVQMVHDAMKVCTPGLVTIIPSEPGASGPEIALHIEGRPWWIASGGMEVRGDLVLRDALRRLASKVAGLEWLGSVPLVVDNAQNWSGGWPATELLSGPTWYLYTDPETDGLQVFDMGEVTDG